jgi:pilus assembly protein Flp/PilA
VQWLPSPAVVVLRLERGEQGMSKGPPMQMLCRFLKCERGATAIEYAIIAGGIALAIVAGVKSIGTPLNDTFTSVAGGVK